MLTVPSLNEAVEWRIPVWAPAVSSALIRSEPKLPKNAKILEIGYNTGMISCYIAAKYGWQIVGYEIESSYKKKAEENAKHYMVEDRTDFRLCSPDETLLIKGAYDAVFIKSVLYHISDKSIYRRWVEWIYSVIKNDGMAIVIENGKGGVIDKFYRKFIKRSRWSEFLLFDNWAEQEFRRTFRDVNIKYFGRFSQFFTSSPKIFNLVQKLEDRFYPPNKNHCFVASVIAQK